MPSLIDLRRRIRAVKSTQQITKAMKMIAASRLRKSQDRILNARPFADGSLRVIRGLASRTDVSLHPLLARREEKSALVVVITADKGLAGSFNTNIIKAAGTFILEPGSTKALVLLGRKGRDFFARRGFEIRFQRINLFQRLNFDDAREIGDFCTAQFVEEKVDSVYLIYNEFKSVLQQRVVTEKLLPLSPEEVEADASSKVDYIYEPNPAEILGRMLPGYVRVRIWHALLESAAAENAARMTAMDSATKNATEMIDDLTLYMNKVRQAAITREIIEVVSGAQAL